MKIVDPFGQEPYTPSTTKHFVGQNIAHRGSSPCPAHKSHLMIFAFCASKCMFPKGHATVHAMHNMHLSRSTSTTPVSALRESASTGHDFTQAALSH
jgi:hypothetical protein